MTTDGGIGFGGQHPGGDLAGPSAIELGYGG
jgi:hypothetical protein